jgi:hypothetical protein
MDAIVFEYLSIYQIGTLPLILILRAILWEILYLLPLLKSYASSLCVCLARR